MTTRQLHQQLLQDKNLHIKNCLIPNQIEDILCCNKLIEYKKRITSRRILTKTWQGASALTDQDLQFFSHVVLADGRVDVSLPPDLGLELIGEMPYKIGKIGLPENYRIKAWNLLILPPSIIDQVWHQDNGGCSPDEYYTVLIPLNDASGMGKTQIALPYTDDFGDHKTTTTPNIQPGDALVFSGSLWHRETANLSRQTRYCLYLILTSLPKEELFETWK